MQSVLSVLPDASNVLSGEIAHACTFQKASDQYITERRRTAKVCTLKLAFLTSSCVIAALDLLPALDLVYGLNARRFWRAGF